MGGLREKKGVGNSGENIERKEHAHKDSKGVALWGEKLEETGVYLGCQANDHP